MNNTQAKITTWIIILAGVALRLSGLWSKPGWYDEYFTVLVTRLPLPQMFQAILSDVHPPAFYFLAWLWVRLVPGLVGLRVFSLLCSVAALWVFMHVIGAMLLPWRARVVALLMVAAAPVMVFYACEGRMYALLGLLVLLQVWAIQRRRWVMFALLSTLALYTHNYSLFYTFILCLAGFAVILKTVRPMRRIGIDHEFQGHELALACLVFPWLAYIPWVAVLVHQMGSISGHYWIPDLSAGYLALSLYQAWMGSLPLEWTITGMITLFLALLLALRWGIQNRRFLPISLAVGPVILSVIGSLIWQPVILFRGYVPALPLLAALAAGAWSQATGAARLGRWLLVLPWVAGLAYQMTGDYINRVVTWPDQIPTAAVVIHMEDTSLITALGRGWPGQHYLLAAGCPEQAGALTAGTRAALGIQTIPHEDLPEHYTLVGVIGVLSTQCHQEIFHQLQAEKNQLYYHAKELGEWGIFQ